MAEEKPKKSEFRKSIEEAIDAKITPQFEEATKRFNKIDQRFDKNDERFDKVDQSLEKIVRTLSEMKNSGPQPPKV